MKEIERERDREREGYFRERDRLHRKITNFSPE